MTKLNPKVKKAWISALNSGEYRQGQGVLCQSTTLGDTFCCLGVLCDLYIKANPKKKARWGKPKKHLDTSARIERQIKNFISNP